MNYDEETSPAILGNFLLIDGKELRGFQVRTSNPLSVIAEILRLFMKYNVGITAINFPYKVGDKNTIFIGADFTNAKTRPEDIKAEIEDIDDITGVQTVRPYLGVLADLTHFPIITNYGDRYILFSETSIKSLIVALRDVFGSAGLTFIYHQGVMTGKNAVEKYKKWGIREIKEALNMRMIRAIVLGRYRGEVVSFSYDKRGGETVIRAYGLWECETAKRYGIREPSCHLERGILVGLIEGYTGRRATAVETRCITKGDPYCEIYVRF
jgi:predicted hydrocarbon binding protein